MNTLGDLKVFPISKRKTEFYTSKLVSAKDGKQGEKARASLPPSRSLSFPSEDTKFAFRYDIYGILKTLLKRLIYLQIFKIVLTKDPSGGSLRRRFCEYLTVQEPAAKK